MLRHTVNIVTSVEDVNEFALALAGEYTDKRGVRYKGEEQQILQAYKRIWGLSEVTEAEINVMFNRGYYDGAALEYYKQYQLMVRLQNRTKDLVEKYAPGLYGTIGQQILPEFSEQYQEFARREAAKITDPALIDEADIPGRLPLDEPEEPEPEPEQLRVPVPVQQW